MQYNSNLTLKVFETKDNNNDDSLFETKDSFFSCLFHNDDKYFIDTNCVPKRIELDNPVLLNILCNRSPLEVKNASYPYLTSKVINNSIIMPIYVSHDLYIQLEASDSEVFTKGKNLKLRYYFRYDSKKDDLGTNLSGVEYQLVNSSYKKKEFDIVERIVNKKDYDDEEHSKESDKKLPKTATKLNKHTDKEMPSKEEIDNLKKVAEAIYHANINSYATGLNDNNSKQTKKERQESYHYPDTKAFEYIMNYFKEHGVSIKEMAQEAMSDQVKHGVKAPLGAYEKAIIGTLHKRDVDSLILVGLALDLLCTKKLLPEPLQSMMWNDAPAFSPDETICELIGLQYSGIAVTNYGARDVHKTGLAKRIDEDESSCNVFLDDFVSVLIAIAEAKVAHKYNF